MGKAELSLFLMNCIVFDGLINGHSLDMCIDMSLTSFNMIDMSLKNQEIF